MHTVDSKILASDNFYKDDLNVKNKIFKVRLNNSQPLRDTIYKYSNEIVGMTYKLNVHIDNDIHICDVEKTVLDIPFNEIEFIQFGILRLLGSVSSVPTNMYYLLIYIETKESIKLGMVDNSLQHYFDYVKLLKDHDFPLEDPFKIAEMNLTDRTQIYNYLQKNYDKLLVTAGYHSNKSHLN